MSLPSETERTALKEGWYMLRYVTMIKPDVDQSLVSAIVDAETCLLEQNWTAETSKMFWPAYTKLSTLIQPVTIDCLTASQRNRTAVNFPVFWRGYTKLSSGEKTSQGYIILLFIILIITVVTQFYVTRYANIVSNIDKAAAVIQTEMAQLNADYATLDAETADIPPGGALTPAEINASVQVINEAGQINNQTAEILETKGYLDSVTILPFDLPRKPTEIADTAKSASSSPAWFNYYNAARTDAGQVQTTVNAVDVKANSNSTGISIFLLPILYSTIGAVAYILRTISGQLKSVTFSQNSPIRHAVRLFLGVMMGLVVGAFSTVTTELNLQPLAIAFLAGYGVEVFFSTFDSIIDRFKTQQLEPPDGTPKARPA
jgi:hypothetical protein